MADPELVRALPKPTLLAPRIPAILCLLACAWFFVATLFAALHIELGFDPAYHASVAKSFALGQGWATHYEHPVPFNPDVTTGPTLLLPAAVLIALLGNAPWVPALSAALIQLALFAAILWRLRRFCPGNAPALAATLCGAFTLYAHTWWLSLTADFVVVLLTVLACLLLCDAGDQKPDARRRLFAGLALGAALLAKALAWFGLLGLALYGVLAWLRGARDGATLRRSAWVVLGLLAVVGPWKTYEAVSLSSLAPEQRQERAEYARSFFREQGSGITEWTQSVDRAALVAANVSRNASVLARDWAARYGGPGFVGVGLLMLPLLLMAPVLRRRPWTPQDRLLSMLAIAGSLQALWFLSLSQSWSAKYALAPTSLAIVGACVWLGNRGRLRYLIPLAGTALLLQPDAMRHYLGNVAGFTAQPNAYMRDLVVARDYLLRHPPAVPMAGCGWAFAPWEMEYVLPGVGHFRDCRRLIREGLAFDADYYLEHNPQARADLAQGRDGDAHAHHLRTNGAGAHPFRYRWTRPVSFVLVVNHVFWTVSAYRDLDLPVLYACARHPLRQGEYFSVLLCTPEALQAGLPLDRPAAWLPSASDTGGVVRKPAPLPPRPA